MNRIIKADQSGVDAAKAAALNLADFATEARNTVLDARKDAARICAEARAKAESSRRQAREEGYAEGFARGQNDGYAEGQTKGREEVVEQYGRQYADAIRQAHQVITALAHARKDAVVRASGDAIEMALIVAKRIVGQVSARGTEAARANLAKTLELAQCGGRITVAVNPAELQSLERELPDLVEAIGVDGHVELVADADVSAGGVRLSGPHGEIDATIEAQLANAARVLLGDESPSKRSNDILPFVVGKYVKTPEGTLKPSSYT